MTKAEALLEYVSSAGRVCPQPPAWNSLWQLLRNRAPTETHRTLSPPLILAAWWGTSDQEKRARLRHHIEWAARHNLIDVVDHRLRSLSEDQWYCE